MTGSSSASIVVGRIARGGELDAVHAMLQLRPAGLPAKNSIENPQFDAATVQRDAQETRIIVHARYPKLVQDFLTHKRQYGSYVEKALYNSEDWTWQKQVARLVAKRPLVFMGHDDLTMLRDGRQIGGAATQWDRVGTEAEAANRDLRLAEYLSYDEIMLGSLLGVSSPSHFVNDGDRYNSGKPGRPGDYEPRGIIVGLVGARFERPHRMDSAYVLPPAAGPRQHPDLDRLFRDFLLGPDAGPSARRPQAAFDADMYRARMRVTAEMLLLEADARAQAAGRRAYVHVVGLGLGVWQADAAQPRYYVEAFTEALDALGGGGGSSSSGSSGGSSRLSALGRLDFAWIEPAPPEATQEAVRAAARRVGASAVFSRRRPAARLTGVAAAEGQLLVVSYAWDGNAFPGNEYWAGMLAASGDPAAACMSQISELHNPVVNPGFLGRIRVLGAGHAAMDTDARDGGPY